MAPKKKGGKKAKEAAKLAELERLAEEQRLAEIEEQKRKEAERLEREEQERLRKEEEARLQAELDARLKMEDEESAPFYAERLAQLQAEREQALEHVEWLKFIACANMPNARVEGEVNTFLTEWSEKPADDLETTVKNCVLASQLLQQLVLEAAAAEERGAVTQAEWMAELQVKLRTLLLKKLDGATADFLCHAEEYTNAKNEVLACVAPPGCNYGLWVNLAKNPRVKSIDFAELSISTELPKTLALASIAIRVTQFKHDIITPFEGCAAPEMSFITLGGVLAIELLSLPPTAKKIKGWTLRQVTDLSTSVQKQTYPLPTAGGDAAAAAASAQPLKLSYTVPKEIVLPEGGQTVGWWDAENGCWKTDGISAVQIEPLSRVVSFSSTRLTALALLQPSHLELPYKKWLLTPVDAACCKLLLQTQRYLVKIQVSKAGCLLLAPQLPELADLLQRPCEPTTLLLQLKQRGINLCPKDLDDAHLQKLERRDLGPKEAATERQVHEMISALVPHYQLASSRWNSSRPVSCCTFRYAVAKEDVADDAEFNPSSEPKDPFAALDPSWPTAKIQVGEIRGASLINALDGDDRCDESQLSGSEVHSTPLECLALQDPELRQALSLSSNLYQDTVRQLMDYLRLFSFTKYK